MSFANFYILSSNNNLIACQSESSLLAADQYLELGHPESYPFKILLALLLIVFIGKGYWPFNKENSPSIYSVIFL